MELLLHIYRKLDRLQRTQWFRIASSVLVLLVCGGFFGALLNKSYSLHSQRIELLSALNNQSLMEQDEFAVSLHETGEIFVNNRRYGGPAFLNPPIPLFDQAGNIINIRVLIERLLADQRPAWAPRWMLDDPTTGWMLLITSIVWFLLIIWMEITLPFLLTVVGTAIPVGASWFLGAEKAMLAFAGIGLLTFTFVLLIRVALFLLNRPHQVLAVAHTLVKEASRTRISLVFIILLLIVLPLLPLWLDPESPLRYRLQTFISRSLGLTFAIAACMTLFLSCASVAFEIRDRQIWQLVTKPMNRLSYLIGKWLGVVTVNLILLLVAGVSTFTFIQYLKEQPVARGEAGVLDRLAVRDEILTARIGMKPVYEQMAAEQIRLRIDQVIENDPELAQMEQIPIARRMEMERKLQQAFSAGQRAVPSQGARNYVFSELKNAKNSNSTLTLRYRFHILGDDDHNTFPAAFIFNGDPSLSRRSSYVPTMVHTFPIPSHIIRDDGTLTVTVVNLFEPPPDRVVSLSFEEEDFELLYKAGNFEGNFFRAILISWIKLGFLAALGVGCSTFLSFPVACLLSFTVFISGILGPFLADALEWYYPLEADRMDWSDISLVITWAFEWCVRGVALVLVFLLSSFGEFRPSQDLVEGRLIEWSSVGMGMFKLGVIWSGLSIVVGYVVIRSRQLAIYSGHG